jgi:hypothetical protein
MRRATGTGNDHFQAPRFCRLRILHHPQRSAVRRNYRKLVWDFEKVQHVGRAFIIGRSLSLPMMIPTNGSILFFVCVNVWISVIAQSRPSGEGSRSFATFML